MHEIVPKIARVIAAFLDLGFSKLGTLFEIASILVSAVVPDPKARGSNIKPQMTQYY